MATQTQPTGITSVPGNRTEAGSWTLCAREGEMCQVPSTSSSDTAVNNILYTQNINTDRRHPFMDRGNLQNPSRRMQVSGTDGFSFMCDNDMFGDIAPGIRKLCYYSTSDLPTDGTRKQEEFLIDERTGRYSDMFWILLIVVVGIVMYHIYNK